MQNWSDSRAAPTIAYGTNELHKISIVSSLPFLYRGHMAGDIYKKELGNFGHIRYSDWDPPTADVGCTDGQLLP